MLARLWWKEARLYWPVWLVLILVAAGVQWVLEANLERSPLRRSTLTQAALGWGVLYALVAGAAAFAGERENRTLLFLDILPVGRRTLWLGKTSFALTSTLVLALVLVLVAGLGTESRFELNGRERIALGFGVLLVEAVAWGLFWSAALENALLAGTLAIACLVMISGVAARGFDQELRGLLASLPVRLPLVLGLVTLSGYLVTRRPRAHRIVRALRIAPAREDRPWRSSSWPVIQRLIWQTYHEARATWLTLVLISIVGPLLIAAGMGHRDVAPAMAVGLSSLTSLVAGVSVFAPEGRGRTFRFYLHHGVRPGTVWTVKVLVWASALLAYSLVLMAVLLLSVGSVGREPYFVETLLIVWAFSFTTGQLCGLVIRRGISAGLVAVVASLLLLWLQLSLMTIQMIPAVSLALSPLILLAISRGWAGDAMNDLAGSGRWVRLAFLVTVPFALLVTAYVGYRAWSVPDVGSPVDEAAARTALVPPDPDAHRAYRRAIELLKPPAPRPGMSSDDKNNQINRVIREGWDPKATLVVAWWEQNQEAIAWTRRGTARPGPPFTIAADRFLRTAFDPEDLALYNLGRLLALDALRRQSAGDLDGAWEDLLVMLRLGQRMTIGAPPSRATAAVIQQQAERLGMIWAAEPGQTLARLGTALESVQNLPANAPLSDGVKLQYLQMDRALRLPSVDLLAQLGSSGSDVRSTARSVPLSYALGVTPSWERARARRVLRLLTAARLRWIDLEPQQRRPLYEIPGWTSVLGLPLEAPPWTVPAEGLSGAVQSTPLVRLFPPPRIAFDARDRELTHRRALIQVLALRRWQLRHGGQLPERLEALVPSELPALPKDPYAGRPFGYIQASGRPGPFGTLPLWGEPPVTPHPIRPGQRFLYSVGTNGQDERGGWDLGLQAQSDDIVYPLPFDERPPAP